MRKEVSNRSNWLFDSNFPFLRKAPNQRDSGNIEYFQFEITARTRLSNVFVFFFFDRFHRKITVRVNLAYHFHDRHYIRTAVSSGFIIHFLNECTIFLFFL